VQRRAVHAVKVLEVRVPSLYASERNREGNPVQREGV